MFLGSDKEWMTALWFFAVLLVGSGLSVGLLIAWMVSGPSTADVCRMQGGSFNGGVCYVETSHE